MSSRVLAFVLGLLLAVSAARCDYVNSEDTAPTADDIWSETCDTCLWLVNTTELYLNSTETKRTIIEFLNTEVCTVLPGDIALQCQTLSTLLVPKVVEYLVDNFDSTTVCKDAGVCPTSNVLSSGLGCLLCQYVVNSRVKAALDPQVQGFIRQRGHAVCTLLEPKTTAACKAQGDGVMAQMNAILKDINATATCTTLQLCGSYTWAPFFDRIGRLAAVQRAALLQPENGNQYCEACQITVMELAAVIADPTLQAQIISAAKAACGITGQWQSQCTTYVDTYAPVAFNVALMYLKPEQMCQQIMHVCPETPPVA